MNDKLARQTRSNVLQEPRQEPLGLEVPVREGGLRLLIVNAGQESLHTASLEALNAIMVHESLLSLLATLGGQRPGLLVGCGQHPLPLPLDLVTQGSARWTDGVVPTQLSQEENLHCSHLPLDEGPEGG